DLFLINYSKISHPSTRTKVLTAPDFSAQEGERVYLKTRRFFIPLMWELEITSVEKPYKIVHMAKRSPFPHWRHSHIFKQKDYGIELIDEIEFIPPMGVVGNFLEPMIIKELDKMLEYRHKTTIELLTSNRKND
ncbi:MAG: hypothetical protein U9N49_01255, partial [Campylobacterota bacterium]|nr:hypothetical protein [Campylobacterota bacterium]